MSHARDQIMPVRRLVLGEPLQSVKNMGGNPAHAEKAWGRVDQYRGRCPAVTLLNRDREGAVLLTLTLLNR